MRLTLNPRWTWLHAAARIPKSTLPPGALSTGMPDFGWTCRAYHPEEMPNLFKFLLAGGAEELDAKIDMEEQFSWICRVWSGRTVLVTPPGGSDG